MSDKAKVTKATVSGPSQANETPDPKFERVKAEIKKEILPYHDPKIRAKFRKQYHGEDDAE